MTLLRELLNFLWTELGDIRGRSSDLDKFVIISPEHMDGT